MGKDGNLRELHIDKAIEVTNRTVARYENKAYPHVASCRYFTVDKVYLDGKYLNSFTGFVDNSSFLSVLFLGGEGNISLGETEIKFKKGDSFFISAASGEYKISGNCEALLTRV